MEKFGKRAKDVLRAAVLGGAIISGAAADAGSNKAEAQTTQFSSGAGSPNIIGSGNVVNRGGNYEIRTPGGNVVRMDGVGKPNIAINPDGSIRQESRGSNSPNIIDK